MDVSLEVDGTVPWVGCFPRCWGRAEGLFALPGQCLQTASRDCVPSLQTQGAPLSILFPPLFTCRFHAGTEPDLYFFPFAPTKCSLSFSEDSCPEGAVVQLQCQHCGLRIVSNGHSPAAQHGDKSSGCFTGTVCARRELRTSAFWLAGAHANQMYFLRHCIQA